MSFCCCMTPYHSAGTKEQRFTFVILRGLLLHPSPAEHHHSWCLWQCKWESPAGAHGCFPRQDWCVGEIGNVVCVTLQTVNPSTPPAKGWWFHLSKYSNFLLWHSQCLFCIPGSAVLLALGLGSIWPISRKSAEEILWFAALFKNQKSLVLCNWLVELCKLFKLN